MTTDNKQDPSTTTKLELPDIPDDVEVKDYMRYWLPGWLYDVLKWLGVLGIPAVGTFYAMLELPCADEVTKVCLALTTLFGSILGLSAVTARK